MRKERVKAGCPANRRGDFSLELVVAQVLPSLPLSCEKEYSGNFAARANPAITVESGRVFSNFASHGILTGFTIDQVVGGFPSIDGTLLIHFA